jgi:hypothetical protein
MNRRTFLKASAVLGGAALLSPWPQLNPLAALRQATATPVPNTQVAFVKTQDRVAGVKKALELLGFDGIKGKSLFLKPNFNSADPAPGSTPPTCSALSSELYKHWERSRLRWGIAVVWAKPAR